MLIRNNGIPWNVPQDDRPPNRILALIIREMGRFKSLVDSEEGIENFRAQYRILLGVGIRYSKEGQWHKDKQEGEAVIPMIAFIEGKMRIPMGTVTRDYLRAHRYLEISLIQCLPESNKRLKKDFLIMSGEWHDDLPYSTREGIPSGALDRYAIEPNFNLVNKDSLDNILRAEAPKCIIKVKDSRLHRINVAVPGFLLPEGAPVLEGTLVTQPIPEGVPKVAFPFQHPPGEATSSQPTSKEEDEEEEVRQKEVVDVSDSVNLYEAFNQPLSPETSTGDYGQFFQPQSSHLEVATPLSDEMGIQRKQRSTLQELLESQLGRDALGKAPQTRLPTPPPTQPF
nr:hypothetical protein CFP56_02225 [Quercus suber]